MSTEHNEAQAEAAQSPADKLDDHPETEADTPGAQKPESEVQTETGLNTE